MASHQLAILVRQIDHGVSICERKRILRRLGGIPLSKQNNQLAFEAMLQGGRRKQTFMEFPGVI
jgi:hypothetical protein